MKKKRTYLAKCSSKYYGLRNEQLRSVSVEFPASYFRYGETVCVTVERLPRKPRKGEAK